MSPQLSKGRARAVAPIVVAVALAAAPGPATVRGGADDPPDVSRSERRALAFLEREVPLWSRQNRCFSCHNNGDAARALMAARARGMIAPSDALADTLGFLARPERWDANGVDAEFSDKRLARLQFAHALASGVAARLVADRSALVDAARRLAEDQSADGSWPIDEAALVGSPATYGRPLATAVARSVLSAADARQFAGPIARADGWLRRQPVQNVLDAAAVLLALDQAADADLRRRGLDLLRRAQSREGGWGPFAAAPAETFDTALALVALARWPDRREVEPMIRRGRAYLVANQAGDGSWPETTRPSGGESYAQRLSTAGWATLALLATDPPSPPRP